MRNSVGRRSLAVRGSEREAVGKYAAIAGDELPRKRLNAVGVAGKQSGAVSVRQRTVRGQPDHRKLNRVAIGVNRSQRERDGLALYGSQGDGLHRRRMIGEIRSTVRLENLVPGAINAAYQIGRLAHEGDVATVGRDIRHEAVGVGGHTAASHADRLDPAAVAVVNEDLPVGVPDAGRQIAGARGEHDKTTVVVQHGRTRVLVGFRSVRGNGAPLDTSALGHEHVRLRIRVTGHEAVIGADEADGLPVRGDAWGHGVSVDEIVPSLRDQREFAACTVIAEHVSNAVGVAGNDVGGGGVEDNPAAIRGNGRTAVVAVCGGGELAFGVRHTGEVMKKQMTDATNAALVHGVAALPREVRTADVRSHAQRALARQSAELQIELERIGVLAEDVERGTGGIDAAPEAIPGGDSARQVHCGDCACRGSTVVVGHAVRIGHGQRRKGQKEHGPVIEYTRRTHLRAATGSAAVGLAGLADRVAAHDLDAGGAAGAAEQRQPQYAEDEDGRYMAHGNSLAWLRSRLPAFRTKKTPTEQRDARRP